MISPPRSFCEDFAGLPLTRIRPPSTSSCTRERESSGQWAVTNRSSRVPVSVSMAKSLCILGWIPTSTVRLHQGHVGQEWTAQGGPARLARVGVPSMCRRIPSLQEHSQSCRPERPTPRSSGSGSGRREGVKTTSRRSRGPGQQWGPSPICCRRKVR
jgi:hypothetical protein